MQKLKVKPLFNLIGGGMYYFCGPMKTLLWVMVWNIFETQKWILVFYVPPLVSFPFWDNNSIREYLSIDRNSTHLHTTE